MRYSAASDYSSPVADQFFTFERTTPTKILRIRAQALTSGNVTIELGSFATSGILGFVVAVDSAATSTYVTATWNSADTPSCKQRIVPGEFIKIVDILATGDLVIAATGANGYVDVLAYGT